MDSKVFYISIIAELFHIQTKFNKYLHTYIYIYILNDHFTTPHTDVISYLLMYCDHLTVHLYML